MRPLQRYLLKEYRDAVAARAGTCLFPTVHDFVATGSLQDFRLVTSGVTHGGIRLSAVATTGHRIVLTDHDNATILLPWRGRIGTHDGRQALDAGREALLIPRPGRRITSPAPGYLGLVVQIPRARLDAALAAAGLAGEWRWPGMLPTSHGAGAAIRRHLLHLVDEFDHGTPPFAGSDQAAAAAVEQLCTLLLASLRAPETAPGGGRALGTALRHVRQAEAFFEAHAGEPVSLADVAEAVGIGERSLQLAFRAVRGTTPREALAVIRLERARAMLLRPAEGARVKEVAIQTGHGHVGRFAAAYRTRFGEMPSETLQRGLGR